MQRVPGGTKPLRRRAALAAPAALAAVLLGAAALPASASGAPSTVTAASRTGHAPAKSAATGAMPTVSGRFGQTPTIHFPSARPPAALRSEVLQRGTGPVVRKGDLLAVDYTGQIWRGKVFDSTFLASFGHQTPLATPIGEGRVVPGWDDSLPGMRVGSRALLVIPPKWGYGAGGDKQAGITGTDTLVFVVDILGTYGKGAHSGASSRPVTSTHSGVSVRGRPGAAPSVTIAKSASKPSKESVTLLDRGRGSTVRAGLVVYEQYVVDWTGKVLDNTWTSQPLSASVGPRAGADPFTGFGAGSRLLFELPRTSQNGGPYAFVVDIVAELAAR